MNTPPFVQESREGLNTFISLSVKRVPMLLEVVILVVGLLSGHKAIAQKDKGGSPNTDKLVKAGDVAVNPGNLRVYWKHEGEQIFVGRLDFILFAKNGLSFAVQRPKSLTRRENGSVQGEYKLKGRDADMTTLHIEVAPLADNDGVAVRYRIKMKKPPENIVKARWRFSHPKNPRWGPESWLHQTKQGRVQVDYGPIFVDLNLKTGDFGWVSGGKPHASRMNMQFSSSREFMDKRMRMQIRIQKHSVEEMLKKADSWIAAKFPGFDGYLERWLSAHFNADEQQAKKKVHKLASDYNAFRKKYQSFVEKARSGAYAVPFGLWNRIRELRSQFDTLRKRRRQLADDFHDALYPPVEEKAQSMKAWQLAQQTDAILSVRWGDFEMDPQKIKDALHANRIWNSRPDTPNFDQKAFVNRFQAYHKYGFTVMTGPGGPDTKQLLKKHPNWETNTWQYLQSRPAKAGKAPLVIDLLKGLAYSEKRNQPVYRVNFQINPKEYWAVYDLTEKAVIPAESWSVTEKKQGGTVTIDNPQEGHRYTVFFLGNMRHWGPFVNRLLPQVQSSKEFWKSIINNNAGSACGTPADLSWTLAVAMDFTHYFVATKNNRLHEWFTYGPTIRPITLSHFEKRTSKKLKPMWFAHEGRIRTSDDPPTKGLRQWMSSVQEQVLAFAKAYTDWCHRHDTKAVFFWGDSWKGIEPYKGMLGEAGYDQIHTQVNNCIDVRRITDFEDPGVRRVFNLWARGNPPQASLLRRYQKTLRACLRCMPDGIGTGGNVGVFTAKYDNFAPTLRSMYEEFDIAHGAINGTSAFTHDVNVYIVNAWGKLRAWPRSGWINNPSQTANAHLTNLPIDVAFISLDKIASEGVPEDADVLFNVGEPGTAWSGDFHWTPAAVKNVRRFVEQGGGLVGIDAPALNDDKFVLSDVFGLDYQGRVSKAAERELYHGKKGVFEKLVKPPRATLRLTQQAPAWLEGLSEVGHVQINVGMKTDGAKVIAKGSDKESGNKAVATLNKYGEGRAAYITGNEWTPAYGEVLKRLIYHVAGKRNALHQLNAPTTGAYVYFYPESDILFVYNHKADSEQVTVRASALSDAYGSPVHARCFYEGRDRSVPRQPEKYEWSGKKLRKGLTLSVPTGQVCMYELRPE